MFGQGRRTQRPTFVVVIIRVRAGATYDALELIASRRG
jgi:hypothetical protein